MNSIFRSRFVTASLLLIALAAPLSIVRAQEEAPAEETGKRIGNIYINLESWVAQPTGLEYYPATVVDAGNSSTMQILEVPHSTDGEMRYQLDYALPSEWGNLEFAVFKHKDLAGMQKYDPAQFIYGETLVHPLFAGVNNDGLADGFASSTFTKLREVRLDFSRPVLRTPRVAANWSLGWRRLRHSRLFDTDYFALAPDFPALLPPGGYCPDTPQSPCRLNPIPDTARFASDYEGRGITIGTDLEFPLWKNDIVLEGSLALSVMRGDISSEYASQTSLYLADLGDDGVVILGPPYDEFGEFIEVGTSMVPFLDFIDQAVLPIGLSSEGLSTTSQVYESSLGFRWRTPLERFEVYGGFRMAHYQDIAIELRPKNVTISLTEDGLLVRNIQDVDQIARSATYEGFYAGVRIRLY